MLEISQKDIKKYTNKEKKYILIIRIINNHNISNILMNLISVYKKLVKMI